MSNRVCPTCGEEYSDTYRTCPFCEEERAIRQGHPPHRQGGKRLEKQRARGSGGAGGVLLLLTVVIIAGALFYVFFGDRISDTFGIRSDPAELGFSTDEEDTADNTTEETPAADALPESALVMSQSAMTLAAGETALLTASGVEGDVVWSTSDDQVAVVEGGAVTAKAGGTALITAAVGEETAVCSVEVEGEPPAPPVSDQPSTQPSGASGTKLSLNKTDFTLRSGDPPVQMKVKGTESAVTWASKNTSVVTVSDTGVVTRVGSGRTTVTATVDGQTLECTVRVP